MLSIAEKRERRLAALARYRAKHAERLRQENKARMRAAYVADPEKWRLVAAKWRNTHREEHKNSQRQYKDINPEKVQATLARYRRTHRAKIIQAKRAYAIAHPGLRAIYEAHRRARKRASEGNLAFPEWLTIKARYDNRCLCCGKQEPEIKLTMDHVIPLAKGGSHTADNVQPLCLSCNCAKQTKHVDYRLSQAPNSE